HRCSTGTSAASWRSFSSPPSPSSWCGRRGRSRRSRHPGCPERVAFERVLPSDGTTFGPCDSLRAPPVAQEVAMLTVGAQAPAFTVKDHHGRDTSLADFRGRHVLLWFYPKADTPG